MTRQLKVIAIILFTWIKAINLLYLGFATHSWLMGLSAIPFFYFGTALTGTLYGSKGLFNFAAKKDYKGLMVNIFVALPLLYLLTNYMTGNRLGEILLSVWSQ